MSPNLILISTDIKALRGIGEEWLVSEDGRVICKFIDGYWPVGSQPIKVDQPTLPVVEQSA